MNKKIINGLLTILQKFYSFFSIKKLIVIHFVVLIYKFKFFIIIFTNFFQWVYLLITDYYELFSDWFPYGIDINRICGEDIMLLLNVFWTNIILINIIILLFVNQNLFCLNLNSTKFFDSLKKDIFYWIVFFIICFFTIFYIFYDVHNCIINYYFFNFPLGSPYRNVLLEPFYNRYYLLCFYKLLAIYVAFASKNLSLGYRLLVWFVLIFFIKLAYMESAFIVDAGLFFLVANPAIANLDYFSRKAYLGSLLAYSNGD